MLGVELLGYAPVAIVTDVQERKEVAVNPDGTFALPFSGHYPIREVWFSVGSLYYGTLLVKDGLELTIDYAALVTAGNSRNTSGTAVRFSGPDAELNTKRLDLLREELATGNALNSFHRNRDLTRSNLEQFYAYDSLYRVKRTELEAQLGAADRDVRELLLNEQQTVYLSNANVFFWNEPLPAAQMEAYLAHTPLAMTNDTRAFYRYFGEGYVYRARRQVYLEKDSSLNPKGKLLRSLDLAIATMQEDDLSPVRRDLAYLYVKDDDPTVELALMDRFLPEVTTPWLRDIMEAKYARDSAMADKLKVQLALSVPNGSLSDLGESLGKMELGADLYRVKDKMAGPDLLNKVRGAFPGKAIYIDFWAVWCGPCIREMPYSSKLHAATKDLPVEFIYLCTDSGGSEEKWKNLIGKYDLAGTHLYVPHKTHSEMLQLVNGSGFPTYVLVQPDGKLVFDVDRPSVLTAGKLADALVRE